MQLRLPWVGNRDRNRTQTQTRLDEHFEAPWDEDDIPSYGASIRQKTKDAVRCAVHNIHGTRLDPVPEANEEIDAMRAHGIDIMGLTETNLNWSSDAKNTLAALVRVAFGPNTTTVAASSPSDDRIYLPGGTAMMARGNSAGRVLKRVPDSQGRFSYMTFRGKDDKGIIMITVYRVCQQRGSRVGPQTAYMQQYAAQRRAGIKHPDPRNQLLKDLTVLINEYQSKGYSPIVMGDFNADMSDKKFANFVESNRLTDIVASTNDGEPPRTYARGQKRLDYILGDERVLRAVIKSGSLGLHEGTLSDHTLQWVDFDPDILFGEKATERKSVSTRQFTMNQAKSKKTFQAKLKELNDLHHVEDKVKNLSRDFFLLRNEERSSPEMMALIERYHKVDQILYENMICAANLVGRTDFGYQRSDALIQAGRRITFWKAIMRRARGGGGLTDRMIRLAEALGIERDSYEGLSQRQARRKLHQARLDKREIHKRDGEERAKWLEEHAKAQAETDPSADWKAILKRMIAAARQRLLQRKVTRIFKPAPSPLDYIQVPQEKWFYDARGEELYEFDEGLFRAHPKLADGPDWTFSKTSGLKTLPEHAKVVEVEVEGDHIKCVTTHPSDPPTWKNITTTEEIETWLARRNKRHHQQVWQEKSYPTQSPLREIIGDHGTTTQVKDLLEGTFDIEALDAPDHVKAWLRWLKKTPAERELKPIPSKIKPRAFAKAFKVVNEMTSSSPSGLHYTLWKAIAEKEEFCEYYSTMMSLPFEYGFANRRWQQAIDCMLEKKPGVRKIHQMRIIGLLEADFNTALKILFAQRLMQNAEMAGVSSSQWGGRANRSAIMCATRKLITWEFARYTKRTVASFFCDLASCFDRMWAPMDNVNAMKKGMPRNVNICRVDTLRGMNRHIRTGGGTSRLTYGECPGDIPLAGEVQGKGDVMAHWALLSDGVLEVHNEMTPGITLYDPAKLLESNRSADAYVDDTDGWGVGPLNADILEIGNCPPEDVSDDPAAIAIHLTEECAQQLTWGMEMVGQRMAFHKCNFQVLSWVNENGTLRPRDNDEMTGDIHLVDNDGIKSKITQKSYKKPNVGLGLHLTPMGDQTSEYNHRLQQAKDCAAAVGPVRLSQWESYIAVMTRILPKVTYPFALTRFTKKQLHKLAVIIDNVILPKMKVNRRMPRAVVYGPKELGGMGYPYMGTIQDKRGIAHFVRQIQWGRELATELRVLTSHAQLCSGLTTPILECPDRALPHLEDGYIAHLHERLLDLGGGIWIENAWVPTLQREGDKSIMDEFLKVRATGATKKKLKLANQVRQWLRVITIAELAEEGGMRIPSNRLTGFWRAESTLEWPNLPEPTPKMWDAFRFYLRKSFCTKPKRISRMSAMPLDIALGKWIDTDRHVSYDKYRTEQWMYIRQEGRDVLADGDYVRYELVNEHGNCFKATRDVVRRPPQHAIPMVAYTRERHQSAFALSEYDLQPAPPTIRSRDETIESHEPDLVRNAQRLTAVTDGSVDPVSGKAGFSWIITTPGRTAWIKCSKPVRSNPKYMTSYRAEMAGLHNVIQYISTNALSDIDIELWCDSESAVKVLNSTDEYMLTSLDAAESDLVKAARALLTQLPKVTIRHVKGHQDDQYAYADLPFEVQLNIDCDEAAKTCVRNMIAPTTRPDPINGAGAMLYLGNNMVTTEMEEQIQYHAHEEALRTYVLNKFEWTDNEYDSINWRAIGIAKERLKLNRSIRISKMMHNWLNVGRQKQMIDEALNDGLCPCCGLEVEDQEHLYTCTHVEMRETLEKGIDELQLGLYKANVPSSTYIAFVDIIRRLTNSTREPKQWTCPKATLAAERQSTLGTHAIMRGHLHTQWCETIRETYRPRPPPPGWDSPPKDKSPLDMSALLVEEVWNLFEKLWAKRNEILHKDDSHAAKSETSHLTDQLLEYRRNRQRLLAVGDHHLIERPVEDIVRMDRKNKRRLYKLLESCRAQYNLELVNNSEGQATLFDLGFTRGVAVDISELEPD